MDLHRPGIGKWVGVDTLFVGDLHGVAHDDCVRTSMGTALVQGVMMMASACVVASLVLAWGSSMGVLTAGARITKVLVQ